jgi:uncharacterized membrane protein
MDGPYFMDAVITPHRSLSQRGFLVLIGVLTAINTATAILFVRMGAAPVPIVLGLDVAAVIFAFLASRRASARRERVQVTASHIRVALETPRGAETIWLSPTAFTRVHLEGEAEAETDLQLRLSDRGVAVARALSRPERLEFAKALDRAILRARAGTTIG